MPETTKASPNSIAKMEKQLRIVANVIKRKGREILDEYEISPPQFVALQWLKDRGDMPIGDLSSKMYLAFSTTTDLVNRLEKKELVRRVKDEKDKRMVRIHLLDKGQKVIDSVIKKRQIYLNDMLLSVDDHKREVFSTVMDDLYDYVKAEI